MAQSVHEVREQAQAALRRRRWPEVYRLLGSLDSEELDGSELDALADAAFAMGDVDRANAARESAHARFLADRNDVEAAWTALFIAMAAFLKGDLAVASGWSATAERLVEGLPECKVHARLLYGRAAVGIRFGDFDAAVDLAREARAVAGRVGNRDMEVLSLEVEGHARARRGEVADGMAMLDEAMVGVMSGGLAPWAAGPVACGVVTACQEVGDLKRAAEWIEANDRVMLAQGIAMESDCHIHRAGVLKMRGSWASAEAEARMGCVDNHYAWHNGWAWSEIGEIRLRIGDLAGAEEAFTIAHEKGYPPHPGFALLRLAQGEPVLALREIDRALEQVGGDRTLRARLLDAAVTVRLAAGDVDGAEESCAQLAEIAADFGVDVFNASARCAEGAVRSTRGDHAAGERALREGIAAWLKVGVPYDAAQARVRLASLLERSGDAHAAQLELRVARSTFEELGAELDEKQTAGLLAEIAGAAPDPSAGRRVEKTFMFTDIQSSTALAEAMGEGEWDRVLRWHDGVLREAIRSHGGRVVKHEGDGFFAVFDAPTPATRAAVVIQQQLAAHREHHGFAPQVRIGLHRGKAAERHGDYFGMAVNATARVMTLAEGGDIVATSELAEACEDRTSPPRIEKLKGISSPTSVINVIWRTEANVSH